MHLPVSGPLTYCSLALGSCSDGRRASDHDRLLHRRRYVRRDFGITARQPPTTKYARSPFACPSTVAMLTFLPRHSPQPAHRHHRHSDGLVATVVADARTLASIRNVGRRCTHLVMIATRFISRVNGRNGSLNPRRPGKTKGRFEPMHRLQCMHMLGSVAALEKVGRAGLSGRKRVDARQQRCRGRVWGPLQVWVTARL